MGRRVLHQCCMEQTVHCAGLVITRTQWSIRIQMQRGFSGYEKIENGQEGPDFIAQSATSALAIPGRLELPTYGLGNRRSIRLSYGTECPAEMAGTP